MKKDEKLIFTIGHSTHPAEEFVEMLESFSVNLLVDVRNFPGSRRFPHFNMDNLERLMKEHHIDYKHFKDLGGRRKPVKGSVNTRWRNTAFRVYADYMETKDFKQSIEALQELAMDYRLAYMCSEAVWWSCHRALISDYLKIRGWQVMHIMSKNNTSEHPYTSAARIDHGQLRYDDPSDADMER